MRTAIVLLTLFLAGVSHGQSVTLTIDDMRTHSAFRVPSAMMEPAIRAGELVYVDTKNFQPSDVKVGSVIAFKQATPTPQLTIKRAIALPGSKVQFRRWKLYVDDQEVKEPYVNPDNVMNTDSFEWGPATVGKACVFVLADNRDYGNDSRKNGCVPFGEIVGVVKYAASETTPQVARPVR